MLRLRRRESRKLAKLVRALATLEDPQKSVPERRRVVHLAAR
jgi:hypothetical protein